MAWLAAARGGGAPARFTAMGLVGRVTDPIFFVHVHPVGQRARATGAAPALRRAAMALPRSDAHDRAAGCGLRYTGACWHVVWEPTRHNPVASHCRSASFGGGVDDECGIHARAHCAR